MKYPQNKIIVCFIILIIYIMKLKKLDLFKNILKSVYILNGFDFYDKSELIDFNNYDY